MLHLAAIALLLAPQAGRAEQYERLDQQVVSALARGDYPKAASLAEEALAIGRELGDRKREAQALGRGGQARLYQGNYARAHELLARAEALYRAAGDAHGQTVHLNNLGSVAYYQGRYQEALHWYRSAEQVLKTAPAQPWAARVRSATAVNIATLYQRLGLYQQALEEYRAVETAAGAMQPKEQAQRLSNLGTLYRRLGDAYTGLACYARARALFAKDRDRDGELGALKNTGIAQALDLHDYRAALRTFDEVVAMAGRTGNRREDMQARLYRAETLRRMGRPAQAEFETVLAAARDLKTPEEQWKALFALGRVGEAAAIIESLRGQTPGGALRGQFLAEKRDVYDAAIEHCLRRNDPEGFLTWSERARARLFQDQAGKSLPHQTTLDTLRRGLETGTLLLVYWMGPHQGGVLWTTRERTGLLARQAADIIAFVKAVSSPDSGEWRGHASALGSRLLGGIPPLAEGGVRRVIVVPDGLLQVVPFEALQAPGRTALLVEQATVGYLPTASLLARAPERRSWWNPPWRRSLAALAAPESTDPLAKTGSLPPLAYAVREVESIAGVLPGRALVMTGSAASKSAWTSAAAAGVPLLHVAAHAAVSEERPERSRILLAREALFLGEVAGLDMGHVDLATLSACETEQGSLVQGEGIPSFSRAFLAAGARAVVTTLWRVADQPTASFMAAFYYRLARGIPKADALAEVKRSFLRSGGRRAHPYYWAAFVLNGEGWKPVPLPASYAPAVAVLLAALLLAAVIYRFTAATRRR